MLSLVRLYDEWICFPLRWGALVGRLQAPLAGSATVLDVGAADGELAWRLSRRLPGTRFTGVDTRARADGRVLVREYDGLTLPFADRSFDCVMLVDVLHHADDPARVLREAARVARGKVVIKDHYWEHRADFWTLMVFDYVGNRPYGVPLPYRFLRLEEWDRLFGDLRLKVLRSERFRLMALDPCKHVIFELERTAAA